MTDRDFVLAAIDQANPVPPGAAVPTGFPTGEALFDPTRSRASAPKLPTPQALIWDLLRGRHGWHRAVAAFAVVAVMIVGAAAAVTWFRGPPVLPASFIETGYNSAVVEGDAAYWRSVMADDSMHTLAVGGNTFVTSVVGAPIEDPGLRAAADWDGDGVQTNFDVFAEALMFHHVQGVDRVLRCLDTGPNTVACSRTDAVAEAAFGRTDGPGPAITSYEVEDGVIVSSRLSVDNVEDSRAYDDAKIAAYARWVLETQPEELSSKLVDEGLNVVLRPDTVEDHIELIGDWVTVNASGFIAPPAAGLRLPAEELNPETDEGMAYQVVVAAFEAHSSGDYGTWALWLDGGVVVDSDDPEFAWERAIGRQYAVGECTYRGDDTWWMVESPPVAGHGFECEVTETDLLSAAAGIEIKQTALWVIGDGPDSSLGRSNANNRVSDRFLRDYLDWLEAVHPNVAAMLEYEIEAIGEPASPTAASVPLLLEYVVEFVAASDFYPLSSPVLPVPGDGPDQLRPHDSGGGG